MSENNDPSPEAPETRTLRERVSGAGARLNGTRGLIAATVAALIVGGVSGAAIHAAVDDDPDFGRGPFFRGEHPGEMGRDFGDFGGRMGEGERPGPPGDFRQPPGGVPGQLPPTPTPTPEDGESSPTPSESPSESSNS